MTFTAGSLFSGIGGIDVAFAAAGFDIRFQVEIDDYCRKVLTKHAPRYWPNATQFMDVRDVGSHNLPYVDVLFGGFPCQDISVAGNGAGLAGARSGLWYEFRRIIGEIRPGVVFLENVPAITSRGGTTVLAHIAALGYDARWGVVGAADAGAPHQRNRWWCVAYDMCGRRDEQSALPYGDKNRVGNVPPCSAERGTIVYAALAGRETVSNTEGPRLERPDEQQPQFTQPTRRSYNSLGNTQRGRRSAPQSIDEVCSEPRTPTDRDDSSQHLPKSGMGRNANGVPAWLDRPRFPAGSNQPQHAWEPPRQIVQRGADWQGRIKALGNAVVPAVVYLFAVEIMRQLAEAESHGD